MACLLLAKSIFSMHFSRGTREITRLDIMAYFDPASNPGSKPQRLSDKNCKSCTWKQNNKFSREIIEPLIKIKVRINDL